MSGLLQKIMRLFAAAPDAPQLFVVSAPSGAGKTSLVKALLGQRDDLCISVSFTTRRRRDTEEDGKDYFFVSTESFETLRDRNELLEYAQVFDNHYGTGKAQVETLFGQGKNVILEIDWQGARQVRAAMPASVSIFILPPSRASLEQRLRGRSTDSEEVIARRLRDSVVDMSHWSDFDYVIVNDVFDNAVRDLDAITRGKGEALRSTRTELRPLLEELLG